MSGASHLARCTQPLELRISSAQAQHLGGVDLLGKPAGENISAGHGITESKKPTALSAAAPVASCVTTVKLFSPLTMRCT